MAVVRGAFVPDTAVRWRGVVAGDGPRRLGVAAKAQALAGRLERAGVAARDAEARAARGDEGAAAYEADTTADRCRARRAAAGPGSSSPTTTRQECRIAIAASISFPRTAMRSWH